MKKLLLLSTMLAASSVVMAEQLTQTQPVEAISNFQVESYLGTWYEIARFPMHIERACLAPTTVTYQLDENKKQFNLTNRCRLEDGQFTQNKGQAYFIEESSTAKLKLSYMPGWASWIPVAKADYWVIYTDYQHYAVVGSPDHEYLWLLSRSESNNQQDIQNLIDIAKKYNYPVKNLLFTTPSFNLN
jgi:apolipoprotein D and lipocalin family protein